MRPLLCLALLVLPGPVFAQKADPPATTEIVVEGRQQRDRSGRIVPMSDWRVAETENLIVYAGADDARLVPIAHNLQKLHFLLSVLFDRVDAVDTTEKLQVTLFGDEADFASLKLRNTRWQMGPYPWQIPAGRYYDPREDGAVMAAPRENQLVTLQQGFDMRNLLIIDYPTGNDVLAGFDTNRVNVGVNSVAFAMTVESRVYAAYAQHYLQTYFPAAYPRWYLDGFGEVFSTLTTTDGVIEYGRAPQNLGRVLDQFGRYPIEKLVDGSYLQRRQNHAWSPYHAWAIAHLMLFSPEWRGPLDKYLAAVARGAGVDEQRAALGDIARLQSVVGTYRGRKIPYEKMTYPAERIAPPSVRQLTRSEAAYVKGRLELGARLEPPPAPIPGATAKVAARIDAARREATKDRETWLTRLRATATNYPEDLELQMLLAESECRTGNDAACIAAADRVLASTPNRADALAWKGVGMARQAIAGPAETRDAGLRAARATIVRANRADPDAIVPLIAYYRSFTEAAQVPSDAAALGLIRATEAVPPATVTRLMLAQEYARRGEDDATRRTVLPLAIGAYDSPEREAAKRLLDEVTD